MSHPVLVAAEAALSCELRADGNFALLDRPRRALLISRVERKPTPLSPWVRATLDATRKIVGDGEVLVAGDNRTPWELALWICRENDGAAIFVSEDANGIAPANSLRVWFENRSLGLTKNERLLQRDRLIGLLASGAYSIQIRTGGNMARVADEIASRCGSVEIWPCSKNNSIVVADYPPATAFHFTPIEAAARLTHFTREPDALWPGEPNAEYLAWLASGSKFVPRDAFQALRRILLEKRIRASGRLIASAAPMACFTQREPAELLAENRWRKGLRRWTYSPYAISFLDEDLVALGAAPVRYLPKDSIEKSPLEERAFMQVESSAGIQWNNESEWRVRGDVYFDRIDPPHIVAWTKNDFEAHALEREFGVRARPISYCRERKVAL